MKSQKKSQQKRKYGTIKSGKTKHRFMNTKCLPPKKYDVINGNNLLLV
jgi:hypothetical protein